MTDHAMKLNHALKRHADTPFPAGTADEALSVLHAELVELDGYVVGLSQKVAGRIWVDTSELQPDAILRERLVAATWNADASDQACGLAYLDYLDEIDHILVLALRARG